MSLLKYAATYLTGIEGTRNLGARKKPLLKNERTRERTAAGVRDAD